MNFEQFYNFELSHFCAKTYRFYCSKEQQDRIVTDREFRKSYYERCKLVFDRVYLAKVKLDWAAQTHRAQQNIDTREFGSLMKELDGIAGIR